MYVPRYDILTHVCLVEMTAQRLWELQNSSGSFNLGWESDFFGPSLKPSIKLVNKHAGDDQNFLNACHRGDHGRSANNIT